MVHYHARTYYTYILASIAKVLYVGVTGGLETRVFKHKQKRDGFTARYNVTRLVYVETYDDIGLAIAIEKEIKKWRREKKERLIEGENPRWKDLSEGWFEP